MNRILVAVSAWFAGYASAADYGAWQIDIDAEFVIAQTTNNSESAFGFLCSEHGCGFYLSTGDSCVADDIYPLLINAPSAAHYVKATCFVFDDRTSQTSFFLMISDKDGSLAAGVKDRGEIGFAIPLQDGTFAVSRFSLDGAERAVDHALRNQSRLGRGGSRDSSRSQPVLGDSVL